MPTPVSVAIPLLAMTLSYSLCCLIWPYRTCRHCGGFGLLTVTRLCRHCDGTGLRLRLGRRIWNALTRLHRDLHDDGKGGTP
jgi:hypothetical protein